MSTPLDERTAAYWSTQAARYDRWGDLAHGHRRGMGHQVTGYDLAPGMIDRARRNIAAAGASVEVVLADAGNLPVAAGSVDLVISRMVFWALPDPPATLREWRRVLAPGGLIVVIDALHFAPPATAAARLRHGAERTFWTAVGWFDRHRESAPARPDTPGAGWRTVAEPAAEFAAAGMAGVRVGWLDEVAVAHRSTAPLRWRLAGLLPRFYTLSWPAPSDEEQR